MKRSVILLLAILAAAPVFAKEGKVKYGKNIYFEGEVDHNVPAGPGALYLRVSKDAAPEIINGNFRDNIIDNASIMMTLAGGGQALFDGNFIFVVPSDKEASGFELLMESGEIKVQGETYKVTERVNLTVSYDEFRGVQFTSSNGFYTTMKKKGVRGISYGPVTGCGSDFGAKLARVDSIVIGVETFYPQQSGLWRKSLNATDYVDLKKSDKNEFTPVAIHRVNPVDGGVVESDLPSEEADALYTGTIKYPDGSSYKGTFRYKVSVDVSYRDGIFESDAVTDTWKEGLNLTEIERERLRKIERIKNEIAAMVAQADTSYSAAFVGRNYVAIKEADQITYQNTPAWIFHLNYLMYGSKTECEAFEDKVLIYAIDEESGSLGSILYQQEVTPGSGVPTSYLVKSGKLYLWQGAVPENYESFYEILSGFDVALGSEMHALRFIADSGDPEAMKKVLCEKIGVQYIAPAVPEDQAGAAN